MTERLLFEIGCEELPPKALKKLACHLLDTCLDSLDKEGLAPAREDSKWYATPRRLAFIIAGLPWQQETRTQQRRGPALAAAFDADGNATPAANGFARSLGVTVEQLETLENDQGSWLSYQLEIPGKTLGEILPEIIQKALDQLPIPKKMRWGNHRQSFVRPVHWLVCLYGSDVVPINLFGLASGNFSRGHRFHHPEPVLVENAMQYSEALLNARVIVDYDARKESIEKQITELAENAGLQAVINPDVMDEVNNLVEWPVAISGSFDENFLEVPSECLISSMETHQRFFALRKQDGTLSNRFIAFANIVSNDVNEVKTGFEKVIRPRLADARFFWDQDRKKTLESRIPELEKMLFQKKLGTLKDKSERIKSLLESLIPGFSEIHSADLLQAASLCKADLVSEMVYEFPELQGLMGGYYARHDGLSNILAGSISEHYKPAFSGDDLPELTEGRLLSMADKLDSLVGIFSIGLKPSGSKDPFALRRAAIAIIRLLIESEFRLSLATLVSLTLATFPEEIRKQAVPEDVIAFIFDRLRHFYIDKGFTHQQFDAVFASAGDDLYDFDQRMQALSQFSSMEQFDALASANKRIANLLKKLPENTELPNFNENILDQEAEKALFSKLEDLSPVLERLLNKNDYTSSFKVLASVQTEVDDFFDQVMIMVEDDTIRLNRLALLSRLHGMFGQIADIGLVPQ